MSQVIGSLLTSVFKTFDQQFDKINNLDKFSLFIDNKINI